MARLMLVNHACVLFDSEPVKVLADPWLEGTAFADSWELLAPSPVLLDEIETDYLWLSHEHPDHFSPLSLKRVPAERRAGLPILYKQVPNTAVADYCRSLGYPVVELAPEVPFDLGGGASIEVGLVAEDSWSHLRDGEVSVLNLNDCQLRDRGQLRALRRRLGPIDVLATQFSYANWAGNDGDELTPAVATAAIRRQVEAQIEELEPSVVLPFAAFVWFCHEENRWWNRYVPGIASVVDWLGQHAPVVLLAPGETWEVGAAHDNGPALERWEALEAEVPSRAPRHSEPVSLDELQAGFSKMRDFLADRNDLGRLAADAAGRLEPATVELSDLGRTVRFDILGGLEPAEAGAAPDVTLSSSALAMVMAFPFGRGTLTVSGRLQVHGGCQRFLAQTQLYYMNNTARTYPAEIALSDLLEPRGMMAELIRTAGSSPAP